MRILLVEDHRSLSDWLARTLRDDRYTVECAYDGDEADLLLRTQKYDLVLLDLALPQMGGRDVLRRLRARGNHVPVLILTADASLEGRIVGLNIGADDYVAKPFDVNELEARIRAVIRRTNEYKAPVVRCGALHYDSNGRMFLLHDKPLSLTPREHGVLETLIQRMGHAVSKQALVDSLYRLEDDITVDAIEVYVHRLRRKLEASDVAIVTLRGLGYLIQQRLEVH